MTGESVDKNRTWYFWNWKKKDSRNCPVCLRELETEDKGHGHRFVCHHCGFSTKFLHH